mmetsp:Transcript_22543/g.58300  ORF Transcript_22543/g.58300 Transcript_22543/m.58300 type:complete len:207 (-) Transcript_22543:990-1610(-)
MLAGTVAHAKADTARTHAPTKGRTNAPGETGLEANTSTTVWRMTMCIPTTNNWMARFWHGLSAYTVATCRTKSRKATTATTAKGSARNAAKSRPGTLASPYTHTPKNLVVSLSKNTPNAMYSTPMSDEKVAVTNRRIPSTTHVVNEHASARSASLVGVASRSPSRSRDRISSYALCASCFTSSMAASSICNSHTCPSYMIFTLISR